MIKKLLEKYTAEGDIIGLIGVGSFGTEILRTAELLQRAVLLCDPPLAFEQSEEEWDDICTLWGNGMGGCTYKRDEYRTYLPVNMILKRSRLICVQVPLTDGEYATRGLINRNFLLQTAPDAVILNFSDPAVIEKGITDSRIHTIGSL